MIANVPSTLTLSQRSLHLDCNHTMTSNDTVSLKQHDTRCVWPQRTANNILYMKVSEHSVPGSLFIDKIKLHGCMPWMIT